MKKIFAFLLSGVILILTGGLITAQVPHGFNYQAVLRDNTGNPVANATIDVRLSVLSDTTGFYSSGSGTYVWEETHSGVKTNAFGMFTVVLGTGIKYQGSSNTFSEIKWSTGPYYIGTKVSQDGGSTWKIMGSAKLWSVPYSMMADKTTGIAEGAKVAVVSNDDSSQDPLFEVKRKDGQTVFAVYNDAVNVFIPNSGGKGKKGGFAIGGFDQTKQEPQDLMIVTADSIRIYIDDNPPPKGVKGGFAIGGFNSDKGAEKNYLSLYGKTTVDTITNASQIMWYPNKEAFLAGKIDILHPDSVGLNSFSTGYKTMAKGNYSHAFGYKSVARGDYSTAIGREAVSGLNSFALGNYSTALGNDSYAIGSGSKATGTTSFALGVGSVASGSTTLAMGYHSEASSPFSVAIGYYSRAAGNDSYAIGSSAEATGEKSFAIGSVGVNEDGTINVTRKTFTPGQYSLAFGMGAQAVQLGAMALGVNSTASGSRAVSIGFGTTAAGDFSTAMGYKAIANGFKSISIGGHYNYSSIKINWQFNPSTGDWDFVRTREVIDKDNVATGDYSIAIGNGNTSAAGALALGTNNSSNAFSSVTIGHSNVADSAYSFVAGYNNVVKGVKAFALGEGLEVHSANSFVIGAYNVPTGSKNIWTLMDPLFVIGNGNPETRSNAFWVLKNGWVFTPFLPTGTGTDLGIDPFGRIVKLSSSARYKTNINSLDDVSWLYALRPVSFAFKDDPEHNRQYGLVAEEVEEINPDLVIYDSDNQPEAIKYNGLIAPVIKALQDQKEAIDNLKTKCRALEDENNELKKRLEALELTVSQYLKR